MIVSCDPARFGSDETVIAVRRGNRVRIAAAYGKRDLMETAGRILRVARDEAVKGGERPVIVVDEIGIGGGLVDRLREVREFNVDSFDAAGRARDAKEYPNMRSQSWFDFADRLLDLDLDEDEQLAADLVAPSYKLDSAGRRVVEAKADTKKRLGRSPDRADAVLMSFAPRATAGSMRSYLPRGRVDFDPSKTTTFAQRVARERYGREGASTALTDALAARGIHVHDGVSELGGLLSRGRGGLE